MALDHFLDVIIVVKNDAPNFRERQCAVNPKVLQSAR